MIKNINFKKYIEPAIHFIIWGTFFILLISQEKTLGEFRKENGSIYYPLIFGTMINLFLFYFNSLYLIPRYISKNNYKTYLLAGLSLYISISLMNSVVDHFCFISVFSTEKEPFWSETLLNFVLKLIIFSFSLGYGFTKNWLKQENDRKQLIEDSLHAELKMLKAQINPHFLFNTLNMAYSSAIKSSDSITADIIEKLSVLMRYVIYESNGDKVPLEKEINYIENFISLQIQRLSVEIATNIKCNINGNWNNHQIAPMILVPFIENVFKHGISLNEKSSIAIDLTLQSGLLILETKNPLINKPTSHDKSDSGIGLINVKRRLQIIYPGKHQLTIETANEIYHSLLEINLK